jgi:hypothetical protein
VNLRESEENSDCVVRLRVGVRLVVEVDCLVVEVDCSLVLVLVPAAAAQARATVPAATAKAAKVFRIKDGTPGD